MTAELIRLHRRASDAFGTRVKAVTKHQWADPTPCAEWDVKALIEHVVRTNLLVPGLLDGLTAEEIGTPDDVLGDDPFAAWARSAEPACAAFERPGALDRAVQHPVAGQVPAELYAYFRFSDNLVHAWDLARATGGDETFEADMINACLKRTRGMTALMVATGLFARAVDPGPNPSPTAELIALHGRRP